MLYSLIMCVFAFMMPIMCLISFRWGIRYGIDKENAISEPILPRPKRKPKETPEMKQIRKLDKAIADYNGDE